MNISEKNGVIEFFNRKYRSKICRIAHLISETQSKHLFNVDEIIDSEDIKGMKFDKIIINELNVSWIQKLVIYYNNDFKISNDPFFNTYAFAVNTDDKKYFEKNSDTILVGTIVVCLGADCNVEDVLFHELMHLFDYLIYNDIWFNDAIYRHTHVDLDKSYKFNALTNIKNMAPDEIHAVLTDAMYYANLTEQHAFMETINAEIKRHIKSLDVDKNYWFEHIWRKESVELNNIWQYYSLLNNFMTLSSDMKNRYWSIYKNDIQQAYHSFNKFEDVIRYIYNKLSKTIQHSKNLFKYYCKKRNVNLVYRPLREGSFPYQKCTRLIED